MPEPAADAGVSWEEVLAILAAIDNLPEGSTGLLNLGTAGGIFVEQNRICWAASNGLRGRLSELLRLHAGISPEDFRTFYERCRESNTPIGQQMVAEGLISDEHFANAVLHHSAESLVDICHADGSLEWHPRAERGYAPQFTFETVDMLLALGFLACGPELSEAASAELQLLCTAGQQGAAFFFDHASTLALPLVTHVAEPIAVRDLLALGDTAVRIVRGAAEMGDEARVLAASNASGQSIAVWMRDGLLYAVPCENSFALGQVLSRHLQREPPP